MPQVTPEDAELVARAIESRVKDIDVAMPGTVISYDAAKRTATVQPCINRPIADEDDAMTFESLPAIPNVPVIFPGAASFAMHFTLAEGDTVQLIVNQRSLAEWRQSAKTSDPGDLRAHHINFATAIPGLLPNPNATATAGIICGDTDVSMGVPGSTHARAHFSGGKIEIGDDTSPVAMAQKVINLLTTLKNAISGAVVVPQDGGASLKSTLLGALSSWPGPITNAGSSNLEAEE